MQKKLEAIVTDYGPIYPLDKRSLMGFCHLNAFWYSNISVAAFSILISWE